MLKDLGVAHVRTDIVGVIDRSNSYALLAQFVGILGNVKHFDRDDYDYVLTGREQNQIHMVAENPDELGEKCIAVGPV